MNVHGYELTKEWKVSNIGMTTQAQRGGKRYFLKKYGEYKMPRHDESTSDRLYAKLKSEFDAFMDNRIAINNALASLAGPGGNIILPTDWFVDDIYYIEATEFIDNLIEDEDILNLPRENILFIMLTASGALHNIHRKNIVHSDLKRTNILAARNSAGNTVAKIIDFDRGYFVNNIRPDELGGDQNFMSPELAQCFMYDMADEALAYLSTKSDIFSLGLVFHNYLTKGAFPKISGLTGPLKARVDEGQTVYCCEAILAGAHLEISRRVGDKYLTHLLAAMLQPEPEDRPTAQEVLTVLKTKRVMDLKDDSVIHIEGETAPTGSSRAGGASGTTSTSEEASTAVPTGYCAPWADHRIAFNESKLATNGYVASEQIERKGVKCYKLYKRDGASRTFTVDNLFILGLISEATTSERESPPAPVSTSTRSTEVMEEDNTLWEEDAAYEYDITAINAGGYKGVSKATKNGIKGYILIKRNDEQRFMTFDKLKLLKYVIKK